jgi:hypothetical protein
VSHWYIGCLVTLQKYKSAFPPSPSVSPPQEAQCSSPFTFPSVPHASAALASSDPCPVVQCDHSCEVARSAQTCTARSDSKSSGSVYPSPKPLHLCADLASRFLSVSTLDGHPYQFWYPAETRATICDSSHPLELVAVLGVIWG